MIRLVNEDLFTVDLISWCDVPPRLVQIRVATVHLVRYAWPSVLKFSILEGVHAPSLWKLEYVHGGSFWRLVWVRASSLWRPRCMHVSSL
jgi:hypothetical protein